MTKTTITTFKGAHGFFLAPMEAVYEKAITTTITEAALKQRCSPYYDTQAAAERAAVTKQAEYDAVNHEELGPKARSHIEQTIARMRDEDTEFILAWTVAEKDGCSPRHAAAVLTGIGMGENIGEIPADWKPGRIDIAPDENGREFAIIERRKWTAISEYLSNGQLTARFFYDRATGEARLADSWKSPKSWPLGADDTAFVKAIVEKGGG